MGPRFDNSIGELPGTPGEIPETADGRHVQREPGTSPARARRPSALTLPPELTLDSFRELLCQALGLPADSTATDVLIVAGGRTATMEAALDAVRDVRAKAEATTRVALDAGFAPAFAAAVGAGRVRREDRAYWRSNFEQDAQATREALAETWIEAR